MTRLRVAGMAMLLLGAGLLVVAGLAWGGRTGADSHPFVAIDAPLPVTPSPTAGRDAFANLD